MGLSSEEKLDFMFKICVEMAEKENLMPLYELWSLKYDISEEDLSQAITMISKVATTSDGVEKETSYMEIEHGLRPVFEKTKAKRILGVLYAEQEPHIVELLDKMNNLPMELVSMIRKVKKEYE